MSRSAVLALAFIAPALAQQNARDYWDRVYTAPKPIFVEHPTDLLAGAIQGRAPGKALDIGMGQGRNSVFLASKGWDVTGIDPSDAGVRIAREQAEKAGAKIRALVAREEDFPLGDSQWDLIVLTYVRRIAPGDGEKFWRALRPSGIFVYENNNAGPRNEILREFLRFRIVRFEDVDARSDWHPDKLQRVERLVAQKAPAQKDGA